MYQIIFDLLSLNELHKASKGSNIQVCYTYVDTYFIGHTMAEMMATKYICLILTDLVDRTVYTAWIMLRSVIERITSAIMNIFLINENYIYHR